MSHKRTPLDSLVEYTHDYGLDVQHREIYLFGREDYITVTEGDEPGVDFAMANRFIKNLKILQAVAPGETIVIHLKTDGGHWMEGMAIYQMIKASPNYIVIVNHTHARSMSSIIFLAGDKRVMMPYSHFMMHQGTEEFEGTVKQFYSEYEQVRLADEQMMNIYVDIMQESEKFQGQSRSKIKSWVKSKMNSKEEVYFTAEEAIELNFAHCIFGKEGAKDWQELKTSNF